MRAVKPFLFTGGEFDLTRYYCVNSIVRTDSNAFALQNLCSPLADDNIAGIGRLTVMKFDP